MVACPWAYTLFHPLLAGVFVAAAPIGIFSEMGGLPVISVGALTALHRTLESHKDSSRFSHHQDFGKKSMHMDISVFFRE